MQEVKGGFQNSGQGGDQLVYVDAGANTKNVALFLLIYQILLYVGWCDRFEWVRQWKKWWEYQYIQKKKTKKRYIILSD